MSGVKVKSRKTGKEQILSKKDAKVHMELHGRKFSETGTVEDFTPEEATESTTEAGADAADQPSTPSLPARKTRALPQGSPASENETPASANA
jgi:hypothetical protein